MNEGKEKKTTIRILFSVYRISFNFYSGCGGFLINVFGASVPHYRLVDGFLNTFLFKNFVVSGD